MSAPRGSDCMRIWVYDFDTFGAVDGDNDPQMFQQANLKEIFYEVVHENTATNVDYNQNGRIDALPYLLRRDAATNRRQTFFMGRILRTPVGPSTSVFTFMPMTTSGEGFFKEVGHADGRTVGTARPCGEGNL